MEWISQIASMIARPLQWWVTCTPWEAGLRVRLGKHAKVLLPGIHFRIPFLDRIFVQSTRTRMVSSTGQTVSTKDGKTVTVGMSAQYAIGDIKKMYMAVSSPDATLTHLVEGLIARIINATHSTELTPALISERATEQMPADAWGLTDVRVWITTFAQVKTYRLMTTEGHYANGGIHLEDAPGERIK